MGRCATPDGCHSGEKAWWPWWEAQGQLSLLRQRSVETSCIAVNRALSYITKFPTCQPWRLAAATLRDVRRRDLRPDVVCETISLTACHRGRAWSTALQLAFKHHFRGAQRDAIYALELLRSAEGWRRAAKLMERMEDDGIRFDAKHGSVMVTALGWCRAQAFLSQLHVSMVRCDSVLLALAAQSTSPWSGSSGVLKELRRHGLRRDSLSFHVAMASARWRRSAELLMEMRRVEMQVEVVSYTLAGGVGETAGAGVQAHWPQALLTLRALRGASLRVDLPAQNAALQSVAQRSSQWRRAMQMMRSQANGSQSPDLLSYSEAISAQSVWR
eukprot:s133_g26.t1